MPSATQIDVEIGRRVEKARLSKYLSKSEVARRIGISYQAYLKVERGQTTYTVERVRLLAQVLGVNESDLVPKENPWES